MIEAIERIEKYTESGRGTFDDDELVQTWVIHHLQIIGEAARGLSETLIAQYPEIPWRNIIGMRHILVHNYFGIDTAIAWRAVRDDLPDLKSNIQKLLADASIT
ncbi:MAG: DUF86 domain-containing protein [Chloroflexi bacterium]|nr:DUF86 domain-containing protein [Chloroflexota bacterium]